MSKFQEWLKSQQAFEMLVHLGRIEESDLQRAWNAAIDAAEKVYEDRIKAGCKEGITLVQLAHLKEPV